MAPDDFGRLAGAGYDRFAHSFDDRHRVGGVVTVGWAVAAVAVLGRDDRPERRRAEDEPDQ